MLGQRLARAHRLHQRARRQRLGRIAQGFQDQTLAFAGGEPPLPVMRPLRLNGADVVVGVEQMNRGVQLG
jgi:hypothetical protein